MTSLTEQGRVDSRHPEAPEFKPLLVDARGSAITSVAEWRQESARLREAWLGLMGPFPARPASLAMRVLEEEHLEGCRRQRIIFACEADDFQEAYLLLPERLDTPRPAVVCFHETIEASYGLPAGLAGAPFEHHAVELARRGWVAIAPRNYIYGYRGKQSWNEIVAEFKLQHPNRTGMSKMTWDGMRCLDLLCSLEFVDAGRCAAIGHSLGGKEALYLAAFDDRLAAAVSSEGGIGIDFSNWDAEWYLGAAIKNQGLGLEHHQLLALGAPCAFLLVGGDSADGEKSRPFVEAAQAVYELLGVPDRLKLLVHSHGHALQPPVLDDCYAWMDRWSRATAITV